MTSCGINTAVSIITGLKALSSHLAKDHPLLQMMEETGYLDHRGEEVRKEHMDDTDDDSKDPVANLLKTLFKK